MNIQHEVDNIFYTTRILISKRSMNTNNSAMLMKHPTPTYDTSQPDTLKKSVCTRTMYISTDTQSRSGVAVPLIRHNTHIPDHMQALALDKYHLTNFLLLGGAGGSGLLLLSGSSCIGDPGSG